MYQQILVVIFIAREALCQGNTIKIIKLNKYIVVNVIIIPLCSFDAVIGFRAGNTHIDVDENKSNLCRVILNDGATTIVQTRVNESVRELVERLLEKRGLCYQAYESFLAGENNKPIDMELGSDVLAGKELLIEQRIIFKLDLPNRKVISVKSKPAKTLGEVLKPIFHKYNYRFDLVQVSLFVLV